MARAPRKQPRPKRPSASIWAVLADPAAYPERNRRMGDNLFLAFVVLWAAGLGSAAFNWLVRHY